MVASTRRPFDVILQEAADALWPDLSDRFEVKRFKGVVRGHAFTWSPALTRRQFYGLGEGSSALLPPVVKGHMAVEAVTAFLNDHFGRYVEQIRTRQISAERLGLVTPDGSADLSPRRILIDRHLLNLLSTEGIDVGGVAATISATGSDHFLDSAFSFDRMHVESDSGYLSVIHDAIGPPTLVANMRFHAGTFFNRTVTVPITLPKTVLAAAAGHRLGQFVETGWPDLDRRLITGARPEEFDGEELPFTNFDFEPDLVEVGDPASDGVRGLYEA